MLSECIYKVLMASGVVTSSDACDLSGAIEAAVLEAQGKQEPVAWCVAYDDPRMGRIHSNPSMCEPEVDTHVSKCGGVVVKVPLYAAPVVQPPCLWSCDDDENMPGTWDGACGAKWTFTDGGPIENDLRYCPQCGKPVIVEVIAAAEGKSNAEVNGGRLADRPSEAV